MAESEPADWNGIVERHAQRVFRVALRILGSVPDAEDAAQEAFAEAFRLYRNQSVQSWTGLLVRLATLRAIDTLRRRRPAVELRDDDRASFAEPADELVAAELAQWLREALAQLPSQ